MANSPLLNVMKSAVQKAGRAIARDFGEIENLQGNKDKLEKFISHTKANGQKVLLEELEKAREGFGYVSSIDSKETDSKEKWLINIIDGEENFMRGIPHWAISLALEDKDGIVAGVVYDVVRNELYFAQKGYGAFVNDRRLKAIDVKELDDAFVLSTFNAKSCGAPQTRLAQGRALYDNCVKAIRNMGAVSLDVVYIAASKADLCFSCCVHPYEVAAAGVIAKEAGVFVSNIKGGKDYVYEESLLVASPSLHTKAMKVLNV